MHWEKSEYNTSLLFFYFHDLLQLLNPLVMQIVDTLRKCILLIQMIFSIYIDFIIYFSKRSVEGL